MQQRDGKFRVFGNEMFHTDTKPGQDSGTAVTDASGTTLEISVTDRFGNVSTESMTRPKALTTDVTK